MNKEGESLQGVCNVISIQGLFGVKVANGAPVYPTSQRVTRKSRQRRQGSNTARPSHHHDRR